MFLISEELAFLHTPLMPLFETSSFVPPWYFRQGDIQTIIPRLFRKPVAVNFDRQRLETPDHDFLDLDWLRAGNSRLAILSHGLEGSSTSPYILGMTAALAKRGFDVLAWNFRGCSGEASRDKRGYHSGKWDDLDYVIRNVLQEESYREINLTGFSVGANITLLYLGNLGARLPPEISSAVVFSAPVDLEACALHMGSFRNRIYMRWFLRLLKAKLTQQGVLTRDTPAYRSFDSLKNFYDFDSLYTAPFFDYPSAGHYWRASSSLRVLGDIRIPTLIVNPKDDPMLDKNCYPHAVCRSSDTVYLEVPNWGGHVGFLGNGIEGETWAERRAVEFFNQWSGLHAKATHASAVNRP